MLLHRSGRQHRRADLVRRGGVAGRQAHWSPLFVLSAVMVVILMTSPRTAIAQLPANEPFEALDRDIRQILQKTNVPSASIAVIQDREIKYLKAYGQASIENKTPAGVDSRYGIGSVSKQFTATAILQLSEEGKLSLDDRIGQYVPGLAGGDRITIRQLLTHTAGYADYCPTDYLTPEQLRPIAPAEIAKRWGAILDFQPGEEWRYCNTCYVIAGLIVERASGQPLDQFLSEHIFRPLGMSGALDLDVHSPDAEDAKAYTRYAFGPLRPAPYVGKGWFFAAGGLGMRARDLALWDLAIINRKLLRPTSYEQQFTPIKLNDGRQTTAGLGFEVRKTSNGLVIQHGGEVSGFQAYNRVFLDKRAAIAVLVNADYGGSTRDAIVGRIEALLFGQSDDAAADRQIYDQLRRGELDRSRLTSDANAYFTPEVLRDYRTSLFPLGDPISFVRTAKWSRAGLTGEIYNVGYADRLVQLDIFKTTTGQYEQAMVFPPE